MLKHTEPFTPERQLQILTSIQTIALFATAIQVDFQNVLVDSKFRNPAINNHAKRIKESADQIHKHLLYASHNKDREFYESEYSLEAYRMMKNFCQLDIDRLRALNDEIDKLIESEQIDVT